MVFKNADDKVIGRSYDVDDFWEYAAPVLPASAGAVALVVTTHCGTEGFHGRPGEVWSTCVAIVGWRVGYGCPVPVLPEEGAHNQRVFIKTPDGMFMSPDDVLLESREAVETHCLAEAQASWDRRHADGAERGQQ